MILSYPYFVHNYQAILIHKVCANLLQEPWEMDVTNLFFSQSSQQHDETSSNQLFKVEKPEGDP